MVAMAIMVVSFRISLDTWLQWMLSADIYLRAGSAGDTGFLDEKAQESIRGLPGIRRVEFQCAQQIVLDPLLPRVMLVARDLDLVRAESVLLLVAPAIRVPPEALFLVWI